VLQSTAPPAHCVRAGGASLRAHNPINEDFLRLRQWRRKSVRSSAAAIDCRFHRPGLTFQIAFAIIIWISKAYGERVFQWISQRAAGWCEAVKDVEERPSPAGASPCPAQEMARRDPPLKGMRGHSYTNVNQGGTAKRICSSLN